MSEKMELEEFGREEMRFTICRDFFWRQDLIAIGVDKTGDLSVREHSRVDPEVVRRVWALLREVVEQHFQDEAALAKLKKKTSRRSPKSKNGDGKVAQSRDGRLPKDSEWEPQSASARGS